jgi:hypothetical protein
MDFQIHVFLTLTLQASGQLKALASIPVVKGP